MAAVFEVEACPSRAAPMTVLGYGVYRGPHLYSRTPMVRILLDLGKLEEVNSAQLPEFADRLMRLLPGLAAHGCSYRVPGGFERRLREGTWMGHVAEHVALELQTLIGHRASRGKTRQVRDRPGVYNVMFAYEDETVGVRAGAHALRLVASLLPPSLQSLRGLAILRAGSEDKLFELIAALEDLRGLARSHALGPTTRALVREARRVGVPTMRLDDKSLLQLGYGSRQKRLRASITSQTSHIAVETAGDKNLTKRLLSAVGLPTPRGEIVRTIADAQLVAERLGGAVVTKPLDANHGRGVSLNLTTPEAVTAGFEEARKHGRQVLIEQMLDGRDHRFLVIGGKVAAVAERVPAHVVGDGRHSVEHLIALVNEDPRRGFGHEQVVTKIVVDDHVLEQLRLVGLSLADVPAAGVWVQLRATANLSTGGTAVDRTDEVHPDNIAIAEAAAAVVGLDVAGIDFLLADASRSARDGGGGIVEVNAAPGFRMHLEPSHGAGRNVARPVIRHLFRRGEEGRIPIFAITGTNGKSTTTRMMGRILRASGLTVGLTSTSGIFLNDQLIAPGDASGPKSARLLLRHPLVDVAVLEIARGGLLREGLGFDVCDVGAVLNVTADHLGAKGVETVEDLAEVKSIVVRNVRRSGHYVLNADDPLTLQMAGRARGTPVLFSRLPEPDRSPLVAKHIAAGGLTVTCEGEGGDMIRIHRAGEATPLMRVSDIPATLEGAARFNTENALAAVAMATAYGVSAAAIREGLGGFTSSFEQNPGRMNFFEGLPFKVLVDYAHNPAGFDAVRSVLAQLTPAPRRRIGMVSVPGDRREDDIRDVGVAAARMFDIVVFRENPDNRGRERGEINRLMAEGALSAGMAEDRIHRIYRELDAARHCLELARPGDLVVLFPTAVADVWRMVKTFKPSFAAKSNLREAPVHA